MAQPFDSIADSYDSSFTHTSIGILQRKAVWNYLEKILAQLPGIEILELNCGTGEDAIRFGERGFNIIATDISSEMLGATEKKIAQLSIHNKVQTCYFNMHDFNITLLNKKFDLIFSNFGGLNCLPPSSLKGLLDKLPKILNPGGRFISVIMPKNCMWETLYFLFKLQPSKAFRRWTNHEVRAKLADANVSAWYYNPGSIKNWILGKCQVVDCRPIGLMLPPSYLQKYFYSHPNTLLRLNTWETRFSSVSFLAPFADHFIIDIQPL